MRRIDVCEWAREDAYCECQWCMAEREAAFDLITGKESDMAVKTGVRAGQSTTDILD